MFPFAGPDERDLAAGVAAFVNDLRDRIPAAENEGTIPPDVIRSLGELGVLGMNVPSATAGSVRRPSRSRSSLKSSPPCGHRSPSASR